MDEFNGRLGLNDPVAVQFGRYLLNLLHGRLGESYAFQGTSVWTLVGPALAVSASAAICTVIVSALVAVPVAIAAAARKRRVSDYLIRGASLAALSTPPAFVALVLILIVAVRTGLLPAGGWGSGPVSDVPYLVLPVATLTVYLSPILVRVVRERAIVIFDEPYVEAAIARGVPRRSVVVRHVIPNCCGPLLTVLGANFGALLSGSIITDVIFGLPGTRAGADLRRRVRRPARAPGGRAAVGHPRHPRERVRGNRPAFRRSQAQGMKPTTSETAAAGRAAAGQPGDGPARRASGSAAGAA